MKDGFIFMAFILLVICLVGLGHELCRINNSLISINDNLSKQVEEITHLQQKIDW